MVEECLARLRDDLHCASDCFGLLLENSSAGIGENVQTVGSYCWSGLRQGLVEQVDMAEVLWARPKLKKTWGSRRCAEHQELCQVCFVLSHSRSEQRQAVEVRRGRCRLGRRNIDLCWTVFVSWEEELWG